MVCFLQVDATSAGATTSGDSNLAAVRSGSHLKVIKVSWLIALVVCGSAIFARSPANAEPACCVRSSTAGDAGQGRSARSSTTAGMRHAISARATTCDTKAITLRAQAQTLEDIVTLLSPQTLVGHFHSVTPNYTAHWWRNLRKPEYCRMVLCLGSCAYRGDAENSACSLQPLFPLLDGSKLLQSASCDM